MMMMMSRANDSSEIVNAAATAIISAESRVQQITVPRRRWGTCFGSYWCFGSQRSTKRISHAVLVPEPTLPGTNSTRSDNQAHPQSILLPFVAPPSSPASFLQSGPPSATLSPAGGIPRSALVANTYSSPGRASIFAIGPYAHETQLVSPPVFSTFTTEPSTANFTPPPEPIQLTTPSSPEVPFAQLLTSSLNANCKKSDLYEFPLYQLYPGSPIGHLISPSSVCSGTSSPFPDLECNSSGRNMLPTFPLTEPPKISSAEMIAERKLVPKHTSTGSLLDGHIPAVVTKPRNDESAYSHRVSFELTVEEVARCMEKKQTTAVAEASQESPALQKDIDDTHNNIELCVDRTYHDLPQRSESSDTLVPTKDFKFNNSDGAPDESNVNADWWANEKVAGTGNSAHKNWAFFPMVHPGVS